MSITKNGGETEKVLASLLAASATQLWQHYRVVQQCEPHLTVATSQDAKQLPHSGTEDEAAFGDGVQAIETGAINLEQTEANSASLIAVATSQQLPHSETEDEAAFEDGIQAIETGDHSPINLETDSASSTERHPTTISADNVEVDSVAIPHVGAEMGLSQPVSLNSDAEDMKIENADKPGSIENKTSSAVDGVIVESAGLGSSSIGEDVPFGYLAKSLVTELRVQQAQVNNCRAETQYIEAVTLIENQDKPVLEPSSIALVIPQFAEDSLEQGFNQGGVGTETLELDLCGELPEMQIQTLEPFLESGKGTLELTTTKDECCQTIIKSTEVATETLPLESHSQFTNTDSTPLKDSQCNTDLSCFDLLRRAQEMQELQLLKADMIVLQRQLNQEKSTRMVAEQLSYIIQSDLDSLRSTNITETTTRLRLDNELCDTKAELSHTQRRLEEKDQRIKELEESVAGSSLLVRKLEEQNSVTLLNRGGIDYMVQAKLAEGRAHEAEQKLEVLQAELLQSQGEVRRLLDRVGATSRERSEMVSSKVHTQLLQIADDRAMAAETKAREREREVEQLKDKLAAYERRRTDKEEPQYSSAYQPFGLLSSSSFPSPFSSGLTLSTSGPPFGGSPSLGLGLDMKLPSLYDTKSTLPSLYSNGPLHAMPTTSSPLIGGFKPTNQTSTSSMPTTSSPLIGGFKPTNQTSTSSMPTTSSSLIGGFKPTNQTSTSSTSHDAVGIKPSSLRDSSVKKASSSSRVEDTFTDTAKGELTFDLPVFDSTLSFEAAPSKPKVSFGDTRVAGESDSSGWSSSDEDGEVGVVSSPLKPSTHATLIAKWEWRSTHDEQDEGSASTSTALAVPTSPSTVRRKPPPIAPKPAQLGGRNFRDRTPSWGEGGTTNFTNEPPSSFDNAIRRPGLRSVTFGRPRGPSGRSLPSKYRGVRLPLFS